MQIQFLSHADVVELTGAATKAGQITNLKRNGIRHTIKKNGWPSVTTDAVLSRPANEEAPAWTPRKAG